MISTVLLDVGGTLVTPNFARMAAEYARDGVPVGADVLARAELQARLIFERPELASKHGSGWLTLMHEIARRAGVSPPAAAIERLRAYHDSMNLWEHVIDGTEAALTGLAARYRLGVVSNANGTVRRKLERVGLAHFFEIIVDSADEGLEKPDPRLFQVALARLGVQAAETAYVGDIFSVDVVGARSAGLYAVLLDPHRLHDDKPCERVASLAEVGALLGRRS